jgi:hypothetical protein
MGSELLDQHLELCFTVGQCAIQKSLSCAIKRYGVMMAFAYIHANEHIDGPRMSWVLHISLRAMYARMQIHQSNLQVLLVPPPRQAIYSRGRIPLEPAKRLPSADQWSHGEAER